ncbi:MAG: glycosyltransferase family 9 protein [Actinomycetota bacterium]|nr:glycosyltransferase family 9 protein [Actinomycetota bacterium]
MLANASFPALAGERGPARVAVLRALHLGDMLCAVPALRALRAGFPDSELVLVALPWARELVDRFDVYLDDLLELPGWPGLPEAPSPKGDDLARFLADARTRQFDLALQLHGSGEVTNPLALLLGARATAGFFRPGDWCPDPARFLPYPDDAHEVERLLRLVEFVGGERQGEALEFPLRDEDVEELRSLPGADELDQDEYACIHPGGRDAEARWPPERFAAVADALARRGLRVVVTGTTSEMDTVEAAVRRMRLDPLVLAGQTTLGALAALLAGSRLLVTNDTGVGHLAAALHTPSILAFDEQKLERWGPRDSERCRVVLKDASAEEALAAADALLRSLAAARP